jgi:DNA helicase-2/ATP-dependent DNA helicase PcrA
MKFSENQLKAINKFEGNTSVIATAGSGKTAVIVNRIVNLVENHDINPANILAITFSRKAMDNMKTRLKPLINSFSDVNVETFHSLALQIINTKYPRIYNVWDDRRKWEKEKEIGRIYKSITGNIIEDRQFNDIIKFITVQKNNMLKPNDKLIFNPNDNYPLSKDGMQRLFSEYEKYKEINKLIEFDDYLNMACDILENDNKILSFYKNRFRYILSDEYQDVSMNQAKLIELVGKGNNIFVVGDPCQAIYAFRSGESKYLLDFDTVWDNTEIINLDINYRCSKDIIKTANKFAESIPDSKHKTYVESKANKSINTTPIFTTPLHSS